MLAGKFQSDVLFVVCSSLHTPDIQIVKTGDYWEIKNVKGNGKNTIEDNLKRGIRRVILVTKNGAVIDFCG